MGIVLRNKLRRVRVALNQPDNPICYGKYTTSKEECPKCKYSEWCRTSRDPAQISYESFDKAVSIPIEEENKFEHFDDSPDEKIFSSNQVCFVIHRLLTLDDSTFRILRLKILSPTITDEQLGRAFGITKQAVSKQFKAYSEQFPQFRRLLSPGAKIINKDAERCLMEANKNLSNCLKIINRRVSA